MSAPAKYADVEPPPRSNHLRRTSELLFELPNVIAFLLQGILPAAGFGALYGATGVGKTGFALPLAFCVAMGIEFLGIAVMRVPVLYLVGEGVAGIPQRVRALLEHYGLEDTAADGWLTFRIVPTDLSNFEDQAELAREIHEKRLEYPRLVIVDTYSANAGFQHDENSTAQAKAWGDGVRDMVRRLNAMVLVVHHSGWDDSRMRGNSDILGSADVCLKLTKQGDTARTLTVEKARDFAPPAPLKFGLHARHGGLVCEALETSDITLQPSHRVVLLCLRDCMTKENALHVRSSDWQREAGFSKAQFFVIKAELLRAQYIERNATGHFGLTSIGVTALAPDLSATGPVGSSDVHQTTRRGQQTGLIESRSLKTGHQTSGGPMVLNGPADVRRTSGEVLPDLGDEYWKAVEAIAQDGAA